MYIPLRSPLHINRRKIQNQILHDINSQLKQIMKLKKGGSDSLHSFIKASLSLWAASVVLFFTLAQQVQSNHEAATVPHL